jgi:hypothetical protein
MDSITYFVLSREARVYDGGVGLGSFHFLPRFDSPDDDPASKSLGREGRAAGFYVPFRRLCCMGPPQNDIPPLPAAS